MNGRGGLLLIVALIFGGGIAVGSIARDTIVISTVKEQEDEIAGLRGALDVALDDLVQSRMDMSVCRADVEEAWSSVGIVGAQ